MKLWLSSIKIHRALQIIIMMNLLNISDEQLSYITDVSPGCGLIKVGSALVPFENKFPRNTKLYRLMSTKPGEDLAM